MSHISIYMENDIYTFRTERSRILCNKHKLNFDLLKINPEHEKDIKAIYRELIRDGYEKKYARIKACLYDAPYVECAFSPAIELMDHVVLYLADCFDWPKLNRNIKIYVEDNEIKTESYSIPILSTSALIGYDFKELLEELLFFT